MIELTMKPDTSIIRAYDVPNGYAQRLPYQGVMTVKHMSDSTVFLSGALSVMPSQNQMVQQALALLRSAGVTTVYMERRGKVRPIEL